ncbi:MAG: argininosuccinate lyase, partial [Clostridiales bacterium]|nr:argininosuccinate lyase [Clostridiales bacterium]
VLSTAALLAIGASMTSFAATGWAEEDGTWVYYDKEGERVTDKWAKSGNNWYWLDSDGEMAVDQLIEDGDNYYYVDINGVMASNQWVAIENEDAGEDDEPDHYWYYFQANGKALKNSSDKVALKTINGKKYAFDDEGKMLFGWVNADSAERIDNSDGDGFIEGDYYFGGEDDGAMTVGWLQMDITYEDASSEDNKYIAPVFSDDEDQTRWFYFQSNGKKVKADDGDAQKEKTINGKKYAFDQYGAMTAEWSRDQEEAAEVASKNDLATNTKAAQLTQTWRWFQSVEDGSRLSKGWFKVVPAEYLDETRYDDDEANWYYADGSGNLYAGEFKTIKGKKYAFRNDGRMLSGLKFIQDNDGNLEVMASDGDEPYETEDEFLESAGTLEADNYRCYYFGDGEDGAMKTGKTTVEIDGDKFTFNFETSGSKKGQGVTGEDDDKIYQSGMLLKAGSDEKYQVIQTIKHTDKDDTDKVLATSYTKLADADEFIKAAGFVKATTVTETLLDEVGINKNADDIAELYVLDGGKKATDPKAFALVNASGKIIDSKSKNADGNDYRYVVEKGGAIRAVYVEN